MTTLVLGCNGYLGSSFLRFRPDWIGSDVEITDSIQVGRELELHRPEIVLNCAGKTGRPNIDWCEKNPSATIASNLTGPLVVLKECTARDIRLVHVGSGCIYAGDNHGIGYSENDPANYFGSLYSRTKILADKALSELPTLILRLRMPFDGSNHPRNLINRLLKYEKVLDAPNSLTCLPEFIEVTCQLMERECTGIFNIVNPGLYSPYDVMKKYQQIVDPKHHFELLTRESLKHYVSTGRSNCMLSIQKLTNMGIKMTGINKAIERSCLELKRSWLIETSSQRSNIV